MGAHAANTVLVGDVLTDDGGTVKLTRPADPLANEPAGTTCLVVQPVSFHRYQAFYPNAQNVLLSNR